VSDRFSRFFAAADAEPRATLLEALDRFEAEGRAPGVAVDLGAGTGRDTAELLRRGWSVVAIDAHPDAIARLAALDGDVRAVQARFDEAEWPDVDLVNSSFSLPFADPAAFARTWEHVVASLRPGGRFCGQLYGDHDEWASRAPGDMTFQTRAGVEQLLEGFEVERLDEFDEDGQTAVGEPKHWHLFHVVARRP
jgi:SAM-dependent methyltransferase